MAKKMLPDQINLATLTDVMRGGGEPTMSLSTLSRPGAGPGDIRDLIFFGEPMEGTANDDFIAAVPSLAAGNTMNGNLGDDVMLGDSPDFFFSVAGNANNAIASALNIDSSNIWTTSFNPLVATGVPTTTVHVDATAGQTEFFSVTLAAGDALTVDIDFGHADLYGVSTDIIVELYDAGGNLLATDDDSLIEDGGIGSFSSFDSFLSFTAGAAGAYYIRARVFGDTIFGGGEHFLMHVSASTHAATGTINGGADTMNGGDGHDVLIGATQLDVLNGDIGNDTLYGGFFNDSVNGGDGDDRIVILNGEFIDSVDGGLGVDTLDLSNIAGVSEAVNLDFGAGAYTGLGGSLPIVGIENVLGTQLDDTLAAGGFGAVTLDGGDGDDQLDGGLSFQRLAGGLGNDTIFSDASFSTGVGDLLEGGGGADSIVGAGGDDTIDGGTQADTVFGGFSTDSITGGDGFDVLHGEGDNDTIDGGTGSDAVFGEDGADSLLGGGAGDTLNGGLGGDALDGGAGIDWASYADATIKVNADLLQSSLNTNEAAGDSYIDIENLLGSTKNDLLKGNDSANIIDGNDKNDVVNGRDGDDTLIGGEGTDKLKGAAGADQFLLDNIAIQGPDRLLDFTPGEDVIALVGAVFGGLAPGALGAGNFVVANAAQDANDFFFYRDSVDKLFYDADGNGAGAAIQIATNIGGITLSVSDFIVI